MGRINYSKVLIGGVVAGIVFLLMDFVGMYVTGFDWQAWVARYGLTEPPMAIYIVMDIIFGIMLVWMYAAIRPRFGAGARTALIVAAFFWVFFGLIYYSFTALGMFTQGEYLRMAAWGAVTVAAAALAGAWLYKEDAGTVAV